MGDMITSILMVVMLTPILYEDASRGGKYILQLHKETVFALQSDYNKFIRL
jgi:hypothetical protein